MSSQRDLIFDSDEGVIDASFEVVPAPICFEVVGQPATQGSKKSAAIYRRGPDGRPQAVTTADGRVVTRTMDDNPKTAEWKQQVSSAARLAFGRDRQLLHGPVALFLRFVRPRPKSHYGSGRNAGRLKDWALHAQPTSKPDSLKLARAVEDALTGVVWRDDSQVVRHEIRKCYGSHFVVYVQIQVWQA